MPVVLAAAMCANAQLPMTNGVALWLDASQLAGLTNGQQVEIWSDLSPNANHATRQNGSSAGYPQYVTNAISGKPAIRFNSANGNTGDYFRFNRISTIRAVFWVLKENAGLSDGHFLLGDSGSCHFARGGPNGPIWNGNDTSGSIRGGTTRLMGAVVDALVTELPAGRFQLLSLVTSGNVEASQVTQDRVYHGSWQGEIAEIIIYERALTDEEERRVGSYLSIKYGLATGYATGADILAFGLPGKWAHISGNAITWSVPRGEDVTALSPLYTLSEGATCDKPSGSTNDFTNPVTYTVTSADSAVTRTYTVTVRLVSIPPGATAPALWLDASQLTGVDDGQPLETWTDMSTNANHAFRQNGSSAGYPQYVANVVNGKPVVRFNSDRGNTGDYFRFNRITAIRTVFWVLKEDAGLSDGHFLLGDSGSHHFARGGPNGPIWGWNDTSGSICGGTTRLMGAVVDGTTTALPPGRFQVVSVVTSGNVEANQVTQDRVYHGSWQGDIAEILIYAEALSPDEEAQVGSYLSAKYDLKSVYPSGLDMLTFGLPANRAAIVGTNIDLAVPAGTDVSRLSPTYTVSAGAACDMPNDGVTMVDFSSPVTYRVYSASDPGRFRDHRVTVTVLPRAPSASVPVLWLAASELAGVGDGQEVAVWTDASGHYNHATRQGNSSAGYPQYVAGEVNGRPVVRFNAGGMFGDYFRFARISTIRTVFWVLRETAGLADGHFLLGDSESYDFHRAGPNGAIWDWNSASGNIRNGTTRLMGSVVDGTTAAIPAGGFQIVSLVTAGNVRANQITQDRLSHGSWQGDIAEIIVYDSALSTNEEVAVGSYLAEKYRLDTAYPVKLKPRGPLILLR